MIKLTKVEGNPDDNDDRDFCPKQGNDAQDQKMVDDAKQLVSDNALRLLCAKRWCMHNAIGQPQQKTQQQYTDESCIISSLDSDHNTIPYNL